MIGIGHYVVHKPFEYGPVFEAGESVYLPYPAQYRTVDNELCIGGALRELDRVKRGDAGMWLPLENLQFVGYIS